MSGYGQFCPVALALEVFGERWTLLVVRELVSGSRRFSEIQRGVPLCSRSVLAKRLRSLTDAGVIEKVDGGYALTAAGEELEPLVVACGEWGKRWAFRKLKNADVDVAMLMWDMRRRVDTMDLPLHELWVEFEFRGAPRGHSRFWLHLHRQQETDLCVSHPGREIGLRVRTSPRVMGDIWMGERAMPEAVRAGDVEIDGPSKLARAFPGWLQLSVFAGVARMA
jgi:DNA-binding HxlR family transcriptional regulator